MKKLIVPLLLASSSTLAFEKIVVISDLDDTIRQVNVADMDEAVGRVAAERVGLNTIPPFEGLKVIYQDLAKKDSTKFYYLSASHRYIYNAQDWVQKYDFPSGTVRQRRTRDGFDSSAFKKRALSEIIQENISADTLFLFFGDNGEHDPESYSHAVAENNVSHQSQIYIRDVNTDANFIFQDSKEKIEGVTYFFMENTLVESKLGELISSKANEEIAGIGHDDVPAYMIDNLDERYEDNVCDPIPSRYVYAKMQCSYVSGRWADREIKNFMK